MIRAPLKKISKNNKTVTIYFFLITLSYLILWIYCISDVPLDFTLKWITHAFFIISTLTFFVCWFKDPGYVKKDPNIDFMELFEIFDANQLCPECEVIRTSRSRHCNICNRCVNRFDHHCPWINNCVGGGNNGWFYLYILSTLIFIGFLMYLSGSMIYHLTNISLRDGLDDNGILRETLDD
jgi:hypothetical protein